MKFICDNKGKPYEIEQVETGEFYRFFFKYDGMRVGYIYCRLVGYEVLHLDDIRIYDKAIRKPLLAFNLVLLPISFPPLRWRTINYQRHGLGTSAIKFLIRFAQERGAKRIEGKVKALDFNANPDLPNWYKRRGFEVTMTGEKSGCVATIRMPIDPQLKPSSPNIPC